MTKRKGRTRCTAIRKDGQRCEGYAPVGETLCRYHQDPHQKDGNSLATIHGAWSKKILTDLELQIYQAMKAECLKMAGGEATGIDEINLDIIAMSAAKRNTALQTGNPEYIRKYEASMNTAAKRLGISREFREMGNRLPAINQGNIIQNLMMHNPPQAQVPQAIDTALPLPVIDVKTSDNDESEDLTSHNTENPKTDNE